MTVRLECGLCAIFDTLGLSAPDNPRACLTRRGHLVHRVSPLAQDIPSHIQPSNLFRQSQTSVSYAQT